MVASDGPMNNISFRFGSSTYFPVLCPLGLGLALVSPEPDLPLPLICHREEVGLVLDGMNSYHGFL